MNKNIERKQYEKLAKRMEKHHPSFRDETFNGNKPEQIVIDRVIEILKAQPRKKTLWQKTKDILNTPLW